MPKDRRSLVEGYLVVGGMHDVHPGVDEVLPLPLVLDALHPPVEVALVVVDVRQVAVGCRQFLKYRGPHN